MIIWILVIRALVGEKASLVLVLEHILVEHHYLAYSRIISSDEGMINM